MSKKKFLMILLLLVVIIALPCCNQKKDMILNEFEEVNYKNEVLPITQSEAKKDDKESGDNWGIYNSSILKIGVLDGLTSLHNHKNYEGISVEIINNVYEGLFSRKIDDTVENGIVEDYSISKDGLEWRIKIKEGIKWSNGDDLTVHDYMFAWERLVSEKEHYSYLFMQMGILNAEDVLYEKLPVEELGINAIDDFTLSIKLSRPNIYLKNQLATGVLGPINKKFYKSVENYGESVESTLFNGPFKITEWSKDEIVLVKNENYYDHTNVKLEQIEYKVYKKENAILGKHHKEALENAYNNNDVYIIPLYYDSDFESLNSGRIINMKLPIVNYLQIQKVGHVLENVNIRKSLAYAIDEKLILDKLFGISVFNASSIIPEGLIKPSSEFREINHSKDKALEYWNRAKDELETEFITIKVIGINQYSFERWVNYFEKELPKCLPGLKIDFYAKNYVNKNPMDVEIEGEDIMVIDDIQSDSKSPLAIVKSFKYAFEKNSQFHNEEYLMLLKSLENGEASVDIKKHLYSIRRLEEIMMTESVNVIPLSQLGKSYYVRNGIKDICFHEGLSYRLFKYTHISK